MFWALKWSFLVQLDNHIGGDKDFSNRLVEKSLGGDNSMLVIFTSINPIFLESIPESLVKNNLLFTNLLLYLSRFAIRKVFPRVSYLSSQFLGAGVLCWEKVVQVRGRRSRICDLFETLFLLKLREQGKQVWSLGFFFEHVTNVDNYGNSCCCFLIPINIFNFGVLPK